MQTAHVRSEDTNCKQNLLTENVYCALCTTEFKIIIITSNCLPELAWNLESENIGKKLRNIEQFVEKPLMLEQGAIKSSVNKILFFYDLRKVIFFHREKKKSTQNNLSTSEWETNWSRRKINHCRICENIKQLDVFVRKKVNK